MSDVVNATLETPAAAGPLVEVRGLTMAHGARVLQRDLDFDIRPHEVLAVIGRSGCGKSTLLRHLIGLQAPAAGRVRYGDLVVQAGDDEAMAPIRRRFGVMFQAGALWSSMTVGENVMLPLEMHTRLGRAEREAQARHRLQQVGLQDAWGTEPAALSGGMRKRAAIARALALDPPLLYLDEPTAGLDPPTSAQIDRLMAQLRDELGRSVVVVTHDLDTILGVCDRALYLDVEAKTITALDDPRRLRAEGPQAVRDFMARGAAA